MKNIIMYKLLAVLVLSLVLFSCYEQDVEPVIDPANYAKATITLDGDFNGVVKEGDVITYNISLDKAMETDLQFEVKQLDGDAELDHDYVVEGGFIAGYDKNTTLTISFPEDGLVEGSKMIKFQVGVFSLGQRYTLNPETVIPEYEAEIMNVNDPEGLTINVEWDNHDDDWDLMVVDEAGIDEWTGWAGATGDNPEITLLENSVDDGVYYAELDPWDVINDIVEFKIGIGHPDQSVEFFNFSYNVKNSDTYPIGWGYRVIKIVKTGDSYVCSLAE